MLLKKLEKMRLNGNPCSGKRDQSKNIFLKEREPWTTFPLSCIRFYKVPCSNYAIDLLLFHQRQSPDMLSCHNLCRFMDTYACSSSFQGRGSGFPDRSIE